MPLKPPVPTRWTVRLGVLAIVALLVLVGVTDMRRRAAEAMLAQLSVKLEQGSGGQQQNPEAAKKIVDQVRKHITIPEGATPTVATIVDVAALRRQNPFYNQAENGDYLVITSERAILYSPQKDVILDVVPVQLEPAASAQTSSAPHSTTHGRMQP